MKKSPSSKKKTPARKKTRPATQVITAHVVKTTSFPSRPSSSLAIQNILVPIDFSIHSKNALRYAIPMAEQYGATLHLIYVIEPTIYPADLGFGQVVMPGVESELRVKSEEELKGLMESEIGDKVAAHTVVRMGKPHQEILQEAKEKKIDLIILATHGHTGVEQMLFGSTAMRVVRLAKCPVMTIRPEEL
jgi:nucleotide-binding universal stress UspA family protein